MDGASTSSAREETGTTQGTLRIAQVSATDPDAAETLRRKLGDDAFTLVCLFASPEADFKALIDSAGRLFADTDVLGCTTAGELGQFGYEEGQIIAVAFPEKNFAASTYAIDALHEFQAQDEVDRLIQARLALASDAPDMASEFAFLLVDGLSMREEHLTAALSAGLGPMPMFGGSSGDGTRFKDTWLAHRGQIYKDAAIVALIRSRCPVKVFSFDHLVPTETRMVVTGADPDRRVVSQINAEPAAKEYARLLGKDPMQLSTFIFAAYPVVVRLGDSHHVRAIQQVDGNGDLVFFSAINEGMVLTLAEHQDMSDHLEAALSGLGTHGAPDHILGCDCILRRIEAGQVQKTHEISQILQKYNVTGFSTYGEQFGALHVNQTLTGVAIYPPEP